MGCAPVREQHGTPNMLDDEDAQTFARAWSHVQSTASEPGYMKRHKVRHLISRVLPPPLGVAVPSLRYNHPVSPSRSRPSRLAVLMLLLDISEQLCWGLFAVDDLEPCVSYEDLLLVLRTPGNQKWLQQQVCASIIAAAWRGHRVREHMRFVLCEHRRRKACRQWLERTLGSTQHLEKLEVNHRRSGKKVNQIQRIRDRFQSTARTKVGRKVGQRAAAVAVHRRNSSASDFSVDEKDLTKEDGPVQGNLVSKRDQSCVDCQDVASWECLVCGFLCEVCARAHEKKTTTRTHTVQALSLEDSSESSRA